jgi:hypothetical protein
MKRLECGCSRVTVCVIRTDEELKIARPLLRSFPQSPQTKQSRGGIDPILNRDRKTNLT